MTRCAWATSELAIPYHDEEWGVPVHEDHTHFEYLLLDGAQAGLSWETILRKRRGYRTAFAGFDPVRVAAFGERDVARLLGDAGIVRNRQKIESAIRNARAFLDIQAERGSFDEYVWAFVDGAPMQSRHRSIATVPAQTPVSEALSKDLRKRGFSFVGPTICYAYMQAAGLVNDHTTDCFRYAACAALGAVEGRD